MTSNLKQPIALCVALFLLMLSNGCGESAKAPEKPSVVSQKVTAPKVEGSKAVPKAPPSQAEGQASTPKPATATPVLQTTVAPSALPASTQVVPPAGQAPTRLGLEMGVAYGYNPEGKVDPFAPLLQEKPAAEPEAVKAARLKRIPRTPLERIDLSQLKLVAVLRLPGGNKALVEESTGKGYIISSGTYIGTNEGVVKDIQPDRIVVEEQIEDVMGNVTPRNKDLVLQKPLGE